jgi:hypothetical protein
MTVHSKIAAKKRDICTTTKSQDKMLDHLIGASTQIFKWYAQLVDTDGNPILYDVTTPAGQLKGLMDLLITGKGTTNNDGVLDYQEIVGAFQFFKNTFAPTSEPLQNEINKLNAFLIDVLRINVDGVQPVPLMAWQQHMTHHQYSTYIAFEKFRTIYTTCKEDPKYADMLAETNHFMYHMMDQGRQFAAFFGLFYSATSFLDLFLNEFIGSDGEAIPSLYRSDRVTFIHDAETRWWQEHITMFMDYDKAAALNDEDSMYSIELNMLESCTYIACTVGEIFRAFDTVIRSRNLYAMLPPSFP